MVSANRVRWPLRLIAVTLIAQITTAGAFAAEVAEPDAGLAFLDPAFGQIDGQTAVGALAMVLDQSGQRRILPAEGFWIHLDDLVDAGVRLAFPAGSWFQPPPGRYRLWASGEWLISHRSRQMFYQGGTFTGRGLATAVEVGEGGKVKVATPGESPEGLELRLLFAGSYSGTNGVLGLELARRSKLAELGDGILMPEGPTIAGIWDPKSQAYTALSRPFVLRAREIATPSLTSPQAGRAHLVVQLVRDRFLAGPDQLGLTATLETAHSAAEPELLVEAADTAYLIWYDQPAGPARLRIKSRVASWVEVDFRLEPGEIQRRIERQLPPFVLERTR